MGLGLTFYLVVFVVLRLVDFGEGQARDVNIVPPPGSEIVGLNMFVLADVSSFQLPHFREEKLPGNPILWKLCTLNSKAHHSRRRSRNMRFSSTVLLALIASATGFLVPRPKTASSSWMPLAASEVDLGLTPELKKITDAFSAISDEQVRYKQLLYMAQHTKEANNMPESSKIPENKVPGCLSTVYVDGTAEFSEETGDFIINFIGDSDGLLTRGLVALLVR